MEAITGNVSIRQIFLCRGAWLAFWAASILRLRWAIVWNVAKMLRCRNGWGHKEYRCPDCGTSRRVPHTCKSRFCSSCGKAAVDRWVEETLSELLEVPYQHLVFTLPQELRPWIQCNRKQALNALFGALHSTILTFTGQRDYKPGLLSVLHTFGGDLKWNPHFHIIITCGGLSPDQNRWVPNHFLPQPCLRPMWRYAALQAFKDLFQAHQLQCPPEHRRLRKFSAFNSYLTQFYRKEWYVHFGKSLQDLRHTVRYVGRYGQRPVLAESRILACDGSTVTFRYKDHATEEEATLALPVAEFIARLIVHIPDEHFRVVRYAGLFANRVRAQALAQARQVLGQRPKPLPEPLLWPDLYQKTFQRDPLACPQCGTIMLLASVVFVASGQVRQEVATRHSHLGKLAHAAPTPAPSPTLPQPACASP